MKRFVFIFTLLVGAIVLVSPISAATANFSPAIATLLRNCRQSVDVKIDASGQNSNAADLEINFNPAEVTILDSNADQPGVQVKTGNAYESYFVNEVDQGLGRIRVAGGSFSSPLSSNRTFVTLEFSTALTTNTTQFSIRFVGAGVTTDSNVADANTSLDLLTGVGTGNYTFTTANCAADTTAPQIEFITPAPFSNNVPSNSPVVFTLTDAGSGVDLTTLQFTIAGVDYTINSPGVSYTGTPAAYTITVQPAAPFPGDAAVSVNVRVRDLAGNAANQTITFNLPAGVCQPGGGSEPTLCLGPDVDIRETLTVIRELLSSNPSDIFSGTPLAGTPVAQALSEIGYTGLVGLFGLLALALSLWPLLSVLTLPLFLLNLWPLLWGSRQRRPWGLVIDSATGKPLVQAICSLYIQGSLQLVGQSISDLEGRYGFVISPGSYRLEVTKSGFVKHSQEFSVAAGQAAPVIDVPLTAVDLLVQPAAGRLVWLRALLVNNYRRLKPVLFWLGLLSTIISCALGLTWLNLLILAVYLVLLLTNLTGSWRQQRKHAAVVDAKTQLRLPYAQVRIYGVEDGMLRDTLLTNNYGYFDYWGLPGEYAVEVVAKGYKLSRLQAASATLADASELRLILPLKQGGNTMTLFVEAV